jgi:hypothetical protein
VAAAPGVLAALPPMLFWREAETAEFTETALLLRLIDC